MSKKSRTFWRLLSLTLVLSMVFSPMLVFAQVQAGEVNSPTVAAPAPDLPDLAAEEAPVAKSERPLTEETLLAKMDLSLRDLALNGAKEKVQFYVAVRGEADLAPYMENMIERPAIFAGIHHVYGTAAAGDLLRIAAQPGVLALVSYDVQMRDKPYTPDENAAPDLAEQQERMAALRASEVPFAEAEAAAADVGAQGWFDVRDGHKSMQAWDKGFDGEGVVVGVLDDGVDFAHPDLQGTYAWVSDPASPYYGWPMAFSQVSAYYFAIDILLGTSALASGWNGSRWVDTQDTVEHSPSFDGGGEFTAMYQPLGSGVAYEYTLPATSQSGFYKMGSHPERHLENLYGHRVAMVVVDEHGDGSYDTVYVDLDNDKDFTDEKPVTRSSPEVYRDMDGDGYADISGGLLVWISDGDNPPPTTDWVWGITCADSSATMQGCPDPGELVMFTGPFEDGYSHGTQCASNVAGQGVVSGGLSDQPFRVGGMVMGAAPNVGVMDFSNHYYSGTDEDEFIVAALGYDGVPNSGDEIQITSNSYGSFGQMWGSFGYIGRLVTALNMTVAPHTTWLFSAGNEGPGYGPQEGDSGPTTIQVGSSTQYGSTDWDSIARYDQVVYGDVTTFFSKGPGHDGSSGLDVLANGGRGAGDEALNYYGYNGWTSWATWGGTSRSAPVAAGNLALVYDAYYARHGEWPTWEQAKALLKGGAEDPSGAPFYQGAGVINADASTDLAAGIFGVYATPTEWQVGDWMGTDYLAFPNLAVAGESYTQTYSLNNPSDYDIEVDLSDGVMVRIGEEEMTFTTSDESEESPFNFHSPDYLLPLSTTHGIHEGTVAIPEDAELMVVRYVHAYDTYEPDYGFDGSPSSSWRMMVYRWTDLNGDGTLWEDRNNNGTVNHVGNGMYDNDGFERLDFGDPMTEIQEGEYIRTDYDFGGIAVPILIRDPRERMDDGYFFGFQHRANDGTVPQTDITIGVEFYKRMDWDWLTLSDTDLAVEAGGEATFDATVSIPADTEIGAYEGMIFVDHEGDGLHEPHRVPLPVVINVMENLPDDGAIMMGGGERTEHLYQNSSTYGYFNWYGGGWRGAGDWRHFFFNVDQADLDNQNLLVHTSWESGYPTDFNTFVLGPTADCASNGVASCAWYSGLVGQPDSSIFGPYTLWPIAQSEPMRSGAIYPFQTSTGGPDDWLMTPLENTGLHEIAVHQVLYDGEELFGQFQIDVGTLDVEVSMDNGEAEMMPDAIYAETYSNTGSLDVAFTPTLDLPDLNGLLAGGLETDTYGPYTVNVPDSGQCYDAFCADNVYEAFMVNETNATELYLEVDVFGSQDLDLFLVYDSNNNGTPDQGVDAVVGSSGNSAGTDESITIAFPAAGRYFAAFDGYDVDPDTGVDFDWTYRITYPGGLPTEQLEVFSDTVDVYQDEKFNPTTASYSQTVTAINRARTLHVTLDGIPTGSDGDLYLSNADGEIVAQSQTTGNGMEHIVFMAPAGEYHFQAGEEFTIWVHGFEVPSEPIAPTLRIWWDVLSIWLAEDTVDGPISAGETVTLTLLFEKDGWSVGDPALSTRLVAGPTGLENAFDRLVIIDYVNEPVAGWSWWDVTYSVDVESPRGDAPFGYYVNFPGDSPTVMAAPGDILTYTLQVSNNSAYASDVLTPAVRIDNIFGGGVDATSFGQFLEQPSHGTTAATYPWVLWEGQLAPGETIEVVYTVEVTDYSIVPDDFSGTAIVDFYVGNWLFLFRPDEPNLTAFWEYTSLQTLGLGGSAKSAPLTAAPGETFTYDLILYNWSADDQEVMVEDMLPPEVSYVSGSPGMNYDAGTHTVTWDGLLPGSAYSTVDLFVEVMVDENVPEGTWLYNEANVYGKFFGDFITSLSASTQVDDGMDPMLTIDKTVDQLTQLEGNKLQYTIVVENDGDELAENVMVHDMLPAGLEVDEASITGGGTYADHTISWMGDIGAGESHTITYEATIAGDFVAGYALINGVTVEADNFLGTLFESSLTEVRDLIEMLLPVIMTSN